MSRLTRLLVVVSMIAAGAFEASLAARGWPSLLPTAGGAFVLAMALGWWRPRIAAAIPLLFAYTAPTVFTIALGQFRLPYLLVWLAALAGVVVGAAPLRGWALPSRWQWPLALWALVVAVSWPVVAMREADFSWAVFWQPRIANTGVGVLPTEAAISVADAALLQMLGILWFDWLHATFRRQVRLEPDTTAATPARREQDLDEGFGRWILAPLGVSAALACALGAYQGFMDLSFWSGGQWAFIQRAAGSMVDANAFGMIAALWASGFVALAWSCRAAVRPWIAAGGFALGWAGLWTSGSRSALIVGALAAAVIAWSAVRAARSPAARARLVAGLAVAALVIAAVIAVAPATAIGPVRRAFSALPSPTADRVGPFLHALWDRNHYGAAAMILIRERPLVGSGVGTFNMLSTDYTFLAGSRETFDNAQNWYRHQLAELGLAGSVGWVAFVALFLGLLVRTRGEGDARAPAAIVKGALIAFGAVSLLGVPAQSAAVSLTFWTFAFWYLTLAVSRQAVVNVDTACEVTEDVTTASETTEIPEPLRVLAARGGTSATGCQERDAKSGTGWPAPAAGWSIAIALVALHLAGTTVVALGDLRVPNRASRIGWNYAHGLHAVELDAAGAAYRWTRREAAAVVETAGPRLTLTIWVSHPDAAERPVLARVWVDGRLVLESTRRDGARVTADVEVPAGHPRAVVRTSVSRTWRPSDYGGTDTRELGMAITWEAAGS